MLFQLKYDKISIISELSKLFLVNILKFKFLNSLKFGLIFVYFFIFFIVGIN